MMVAVISPLGVVSKAALVLTYLFESLMFPTIFALSIRGLGANTERASSILMMSVVGGAIGPLALGYVADMLSISQAFVVPLATFIVVWAFAMYMMRHGGTEHQGGVQQRLRSLRHGQDTGSLP